MNKLQSAVVVAAVFAFVGCGGPAQDPANVEICEHLAEGPAASVTAAESMPPAISDDHKRYDVTLIDVNSQKGGSVTFASGEAGEFIFGLNKDVPLTVKDASGTTVAAEATARSVPECDAVKARYAYDLAVGTYTLTFGPTAETSVGVVVEHGAHTGE